jgi:CHAT domain-containing protein
MHRLSFVTATLLSALISPLALTANLLLPVQAQVIVQQNREAEAKRLLQVAHDYLKAGEAFKAIEPATQSAKIAVELKNRDLTGQAYVVAARACSTLGLDPQAIQLAQKAITLAQATKNRQLEGTALVWQAFSTSSSFQKQQAIALAQKALEIAREIKDQELEGWAYFALSGVLGEKQGFDAAQKALEIARKLQNQELEAWANLGLASSNAELNDYQKASDAVQQVLKIAQTTKNRTLEGYAFAFETVAAAGSNNNGQMLQSATKALDLSQELNNPQISIIASIGVIVGLVKEGSYLEAVKGSEGVIQRAHQLKNFDYELLALNLQISSYTELEEHQKAIEPARRILEIAQEQKSRDTELVGLLALARAYAGSHQSEMATKVLQQADTIAQSLPAPRAKVEALIQVRSIYENIGKTPKVTELDQQILAMAKQQDDPDLVWDIANASATSRFLRSGDFRNAAKAFEDYLAIAQRKDQVHAAKLSIVGAFYLLAEDYKKVEEITSFALHHAKKTNDRDEELSALLGATFVYSLTQNPTKLKEILNFELPKFQRSQNMGERSTSFFISYLIFNSIEDHQKAIESMEGYEKLVRESSNNTSLESKNAALFVVEMFRVLSARNYAKVDRNQEAIAILKNGFSKLDAFSSLLSPYLKTSGFEASGQEKALNVIKALLLTQIAETYRHSGSNLDAIAYYRKALSIPVDFSANQITRPSNSPNSRTLVYAIGAKVDQLSNLNLLLFSYYRSVIYTGLARTHQQLNLPITSATYYKQAINELEQKRSYISSRFPKSTPDRAPNLTSSNLKSFSQDLFLKGSLGDFEGSRNSDIYRELANLLITQGRLGEAQQVLELLKVQELNEFSKGTRSETPGSEIGFNETEKQLVKDYGSLIAFGNQLEDCKAKQCSQLAELESKYNSLFNAFTQLTQAIEKRAKDSQTQAVSVRTDDFNQSASKIANQPNTVLIYPLVLPDKVYLLWMARGKVRGSQVCAMGQTELWTTVKAFHDSLRNSNSDVTQVKAAGKVLYDCLIKPLEPELAKNNIQNLVFVPDRAINYIPIGALFDGQKYLVERYTTSTVLSAGFTDQKERLPASTQNTFVLALGMSNAKPGFAALPNVPLELSEIVKQKPSDTKGIYPGLELLNQAFTLDALRSNLHDRKILHIATHGAFVPEDPKASFLLLGDGKKYPIYQVQDLDELRNVHLVVLSACETALGGADQNGIEIAGISSYFLKDKAKAVIASLWQVNDASTSLLMQQFYRKLATGKMTKAEALQHAQLSLLQGKLAPNDALQQRATLIVKSSPQTQRSQTSDFSHPYYWAPFILIGNSL